MTTQPFPADSVKQYIGTPMNAPTGMATILMKTNRYYTDGTLLKTGISYSVTTAWAKTAVDSGWAEDVPRVLPELPTPGGLTAAQVLATQALVSGAGNLMRLPSVPSSKTGSVSDAYTGGATPWTKLYGPNELRQAPWGGSAELTTPSVAAVHVTAQNAANGPAMFRREGAAMLIRGSVITGNTGNPTFGNFNNQSAGLAAGALANTTIGVLVYCHRLVGTASIYLRVGLNGSNYVKYKFTQDYSMLQEGWNFLIAHTGEAIGAQATGQQDFQSAGSVTNGWEVGVGSFNFTQAVGYIAVEFLGVRAQTSYWLEGIYTGGKDKARLTIGFDIQGNGLDLAKQTLDKYGLLGYAAVPTANGNPATPTYLWSAGDVARMQALYAAGWDIIQHSVTHNSLGTYADDAMLIAEIEACRAQIIAIGCPAGADLMATPNGSWSNRLVALAARAGVRWMRHVNNAPMLIPRGLGGMINPLIQGAQTIANQTDAVRTLAFVDLGIQYGASVHLYTHGVVAGASDSINTNVGVFDAVCAGIAARVAAGTLDNVTPSAFVRDSAPPTPAGSLVAPTRLAIPAGTSPYSLINVTYTPLRFVISGGTVSAIEYSRDGSTFDATGQISGQFDVAPGDRLRITYTVSPTIVQYSI